MAVEGEGVTKQSCNVLLADEGLALVVPEGLEKNWISEGLAGGAVQRARDVVLAEAFLAEVMTGMFCRLLAPRSASPGSLVVLGASYAAQLYAQPDV